MRCDDVAKRLAKIYPDVIAIHPEMDTVLSNAIMVLRSEAMAHHCVEDFNTEYVASVTFIVLLMILISVLRSHWTRL